MVVCVGGGEEYCTWSKTLMPDRSTSPSASSADPSAPASFRSMNSSNATFNRPNILRSTAWFKSPATSRHTAVTSSMVTASLASMSCTSRIPKNFMNDTVPFPADNSANSLSR